MWKWSVSQKQMCALGVTNVMDTDIMAPQIYLIHMYT